jgi:hypothetical protein
MPDITVVDHQASKHAIKAAPHSAKTAATPPHRTSLCELYTTPALCPGPSSRHPRTLPAEVNPISRSGHRGTGSMPRQPPSTAAASPHSVARQRPTQSHLLRSGREGPGSAAPKLQSQRPGSLLRAKDREAAQERRHSTTRSSPGVRPAPHRAQLAIPATEARGRRPGVPTDTGAKPLTASAASSPRATFGGRGRRHRGLASGSGGGAVSREINRWRL